MSVPGLVIDQLPQLGAVERPDPLAERGRRQVV